MKNLWAPVLLIFLFVFLGCKNETVVGKWKMTRKYDVMQGKWIDVDFKDDFIEFHSNGDMDIHISGKTQMIGTYTTDTSLTPHRLHLTRKDDKSQFKQIFKFEDKKLIMKAPTDQKYDFPNDFGVDPKYELVEYTRK